MADSNPRPVAAGWVSAAAPRVMVMASLIGAPGGLTAGGIHTAAQRWGRLAWSSVGKTLRVFAAEGLVCEIATGSDGHAAVGAAARRYRFLAPGAPIGVRAQVRCPVCGRTERLNSLYVTRLLADVQRHHARRTQGAQVQIVAPCVGCAGAPGR